MENETKSFRLRVAVETLGCKLNQAESQELVRELTAGGCDLVGADEKADIYVLNTCSVTHVADRKSRHLLRLARRRNPAAFIVASGCYADSGRDSLARMDAVDLLLGNSQKMNLAAILREKGLIEASGRPGGVQKGRTRSFIKIQDGCNSSCAYCIVPRLRGPEESRSSDDIVADVLLRQQEGCAEVVLTGTEPGRYAWQGQGLRDLLAQILSNTQIGRLRISSIQPPEADRALLALWDNPRLCRHFHLSLQSGSSQALKRMMRIYNPDQYREAVRLIRATVPGASITSDIIAGFPGETDREFEESLAFCAEMTFARLHVFPFSPRPGTLAAGMPAPVADSLKRERSRKLLALAADNEKEFRSGFLAEVVTVLFEQGRGGLWWGYTDNYLKVYSISAQTLTNCLRKVKLERLFRDGVEGEITAVLEHN